MDAAEIINNLGCLVEASFIEAAVVAMITGLITGGLSSIGTITSMKIHIDYIRKAIDSHDVRLSSVEKEVHEIAGTVDLMATGPARRV